MIKIIEKIGRNLSSAVSWTKFEDDASILGRKCWKKKDQNNALFFKKIIFKAFLCIQIERNSFICQSYIKNSFVYKTKINKQKGTVAFTKTTETNSFLYKTNRNKQKQTAVFTKQT